MCVYVFRVTVVSAVASELEGPGTFLCGVYMFFPRPGQGVSTGYFHFLQQCKDMQSGELELLNCPLGVTVYVCLCDGLVTCPGCVLPSAL